MANESWLDSTDVRVTSEDGRTSYLYEVDSSGNRTRREGPEHKADGAVDAFISSRDLDDLFWGRREKRA
jgi:hypothetical protein